MAFLSADKTYLLFLKLKREYNALDRFHIRIRKIFPTNYLYNLLLHRKFVRFFPYRIIIDASTICNLHCPICPTGSGKTGLTKGLLEFLKFKILIDEVCPYIRWVHLSNKGEIFLNPEIFKITEYAKSKKMLLEADSNLNYFNKDMAEKLVKSGMDYLNVSIDGASQKTYSVYRKGGNFNRVIHHIKLINTAKKKYGSKKPVLIWQFIVFGHNEHELKKAECFAKKLNMEFRIRANDWDIFYSSPKNKKFQGNFLKKNGCGNICSQMWYSPVINWNGNMLGCCVNINENKHFGNIFEKGFFNIYFGEKMSIARNFLKARLNSAPNNISCSSCKKYKEHNNLDI